MRFLWPTSHRFPKPEKLGEINHYILSNRDTLECLFKAVLFNLEAVWEKPVSSVCSEVLFWKNDTRKEIWLLNVLRFVRRSTILKSKPELLEKVVKKSHHSGKVYYVNHYSLYVWNLNPIISIYIILPNLLM